MDEQMDEVTNKEMVGYLIVLVPVFILFLIFAWGVVYSIYEHNLPMPCSDYYQSDYKSGDVPIKCIKGAKS